MLPSVRELLAFANHKANLQTQSPATQFTPKAAPKAAPAPSIAQADLDCASRQTSDAAEPIVFPCSISTNTTSTNTRSQESSTVATSTHDPQWPEPQATVKQRPGRKARSISRYSSSSGARQYKCGLQSCLAVFKRPEHLKRHMLTHTQVRPFLCEAANCGKRFSRRDNYITHMKKHEPEDLPPSFASENVSRSSSRCSSTKVRRTDEMSDAATGSSSGPGCRQSPVGISSIQALLNDDSDHDSERSSKDKNSSSSSSSYRGSSPGLLSTCHQNDQQLPPLELLAHASIQTVPSPTTSKRSLDDTAQQHATTPSYDRPAVALGLPPTQAIRVSLSTDSHQSSGNEQQQQLGEKQKMDLSAVSSSFLFTAGDPSKPFMCSIC
ncbi:hypothetical protein FB639_003209, partial [Coemansia asiatica]